MIVSLPAAFLVPMLAGIACAAIFWPRGRPLRSDIPLVATFGAGLGLGASSITFFLWLVVVGPTPVYFALEIFALVVLLLVAWRRVDGSAAATLPPPESSPPAPLVRWLLTPGFVLALIAALATFAYRSATHPHGGWDAATIWNLRARFLFRGAAHWQDAFSDLLGTWTHADYPLLVPGAVTRAWSVIGSDTPLVPMAVALLFTVATAALLAAALSSLRSRGQGLLAGVLLLCTHAFVWEGTTQYADVPLAFFMLAAFAALALGEAMKEGAGRLVALAGFSAGLAAWTKNEGLLFALALLIAHLLATGRSRGWRSALRREAIMLLGLLPVLLVIGMFKWAIAPGNDLLASLRFAEILDRLASPWRYGFVLKAFAGRFLSLGGWAASMPLVLAVYMLAMGRNAGAGERTTVATTSVALGLVAAGYFFVYVVTPYDLVWHVETSMLRLIIHVWPSLLFLLLLVARTPEDAVGRTSPQPSAESAAR